MTARRKRGVVPDDGAGGMNGDDPNDGCVARFQRGDRLFGKKKLKTEVKWSYKFFEMGNVGQFFNLFHCTASYGSKISKNCPTFLDSF